jgi:hypothetical protein
VAALVQDIAISVRAVLLDPSPGTTWPDTTLLEWFNDVLAAASNLKRDINPQVIACPMVADTVQALPATALQLLEPYFNTTSKAGATLADQTILTRRLPAWRSTTATLDATDIMVDERAPLQFFCYPPNNGSGSLTALCGVIPIISSPTYPLITCTVPLPVPDNYRFAIEAGIISRALGANTRRQDIQKSAFYWQQFESGIKSGQMAQMASEPIDASKEVV